MREVAAHSSCAPAPQAPARNASPTPHPHTHARPPQPSLDTYNSHRKMRRPRLLAEKRVYRPQRQNTLARIEETPSQSLQPSADLCSTRPVMRSRSNVSADTGRSVPVCDLSQDLPDADSSPQYAEPKGSDSSSDGGLRGPVSMSDLPLAVPVPHPHYSYYRDDGCRLDQLRKYNKKLRKLSAKRSNVYLAFMY